MFSDHSKSVFLERYNFFVGPAYRVNLFLEVREHRANITRTSHNKCGPKVRTTVPEVMKCIKTHKNYFNKVHCTTTRVYLSTVWCFDQMRVWHEPLFRGSRTSRTSPETDSWNSALNSAKGVPTHEKQQNMHEICSNASKYWLAWSIKHLLMFWQDVQKLRVCICRVGRESVQNNAKHVLMHEKYQRIVELI